MEQKTETQKRLEKQIQFILELDKLKEIKRRSYITNVVRLENSSEHSWHVATMAVLLSEHARERVDVFKVVKMLLVHDVIEIDAGDTYCYDTEGMLDKKDRENRAADRLFSLLPDDQTVELRDVWDEFEAAQTPEAKFARSLDRLMPMLHNYHTQGKSWQEHGVNVDQILERNREMDKGAPALWQYVRPMVEDAVQKGYLAGSPGNERDSSSTDKQD